MANANKIRKAVIPAAGLGTRFLPATKATPKEMLPIINTPTIQLIVEEALNSGIEEILIISGHTKRAIEDHFDTSPALELELSRSGKTKELEMVREIASIRVHYIRQKHMKGLGDAILCAKPFMGEEPFAVLLGDDVVYNPKRPAIGQLIEIYEKTGASVLGCQMVTEEQISAYGSVAGEKVQVAGMGELTKVKSLVEKPKASEAPSLQAVLGRYIVKPEVFEIIEKTAPGKGGEVQFTDALSTLAQQDTVYAFNFEGKRYDLGDKLGFLKAQVEYGLRHDELREDFTEYLKAVVSKL